MELVPKNFTLTSSSPGFVANFFAASRLHHLSPWKSDLIDYVAKHTTTSKKPSKPTDIYRVIMHVDMDCFFASVGVRDRPHLRGKPVAVAHSTGGINLDYSSSEIASCNYEARARGVKNGMFIGSIKAIAPDLIIIPYEFEKYDECSKAIYQILLRDADYVQAVSCDEAYIDVTYRIKQQLQAEGYLPSHGGSSRFQTTELGTAEEEDYLAARRLQEIAMDLAEQLRKEIYSETNGCAASVGVSYNLLLARLATQKAKPNGAYFLAATDIYSLLNPLSVRELPGFGHSIMEKCQQLNLLTCEDVRKCSLSLLKKELGERTAECLHQFVHGRDERILENKPRQSIGSDINWGVRFTKQEELILFLQEFTDEVFKRLSQNDYIASHLTVTMKKKLYEGEPGKFLGCGHCQDFSKSVNCFNPIKTKEQLYSHVLQLVKELNLALTDIRGIGIHLKKLVRKTQMNSTGNFFSNLSRTGSSSEWKEGAVEIAPRNVPNVPNANVTRPSAANEPNERLEANLHQASIEDSSNILKRKATMLHYFAKSTSAASDSSSLNALDSVSRKPKSALPIDLLSEDSNEFSIIEDGLVQNDEGILIREDSRGSAHDESEKTDSSSFALEGRKFSSIFTASSTLSTTPSISSFPPNQTKIVKTTSNTSVVRKLSSKQHLTASPNKRVVESSTIANYFNAQGKKRKEDEDITELLSLLRERGIDEDFFFSLPTEIQEEQLQIIRRSCSTNRSHEDEQSHPPVKRAKS